MTFVLVLRVFFFCHWNLNHQFLSIINNLNHQLYYCRCSCRSSRICMDQWPVRPPLGDLKLSQVSPTWQAKMCTERGTLRPCRLVWATTGCDIRMKRSRLLRIYVLCAGRPTPMRPSRPVHPSENRLDETKPWPEISPQVQLLKQTKITSAINSIRFICVFFCVFICVSLDVSDGTPEKIQCQYKIILNFKNLLAVFNFQLGTLSVVVRLIIENKKYLFIIFKKLQKIFLYNI